MHACHMHACHAYHIVLPMQPVSAVHRMVLCAPAMLSVLSRWKVPHVLVLNSCEAMCASQQTVEHLCLHCSWRSRQDELHRQGHHKLPHKCRVSSLPLSMPICMCPRHLSCCGVCMIPTVLLCAHLQVCCSCQMCEVLCCTIVCVYNHSGAQHCKLSKCCSWDWLTLSLVCRCLEGLVRFVGSVRSGLQQQSDPGRPHPHWRQEGQPVPGGGLPPGRGGSE